MGHKVPKEWGHCHWNRWGQQGKYLCHFLPQASHTKWTLWAKLSGALPCGLRDSTKQGSSPWQYKKYSVTFASQMSLPMDSLFMNSGILNWAVRAIVVSRDQVPRPTLSSWLRLSTFSFSLISLITPCILHQSLLLISWRSLTQHCRIKWISGHARGKPLSQPLCHRKSKTGTKPIIPSPSLFIPLFLRLHLVHLFLLPSNLLWPLQPLRSHRHQLLLLQIQQLLTSHLRTSKLHGTKRCGGTGSFVTGVGRMKKRLSKEMREITPVHLISLFTLHHFVLRD